MTALGWLFVYACGLFGLACFSAFVEGMVQR